MQSVVCSRKLRNPQRGSEPQLPDKVKEPTSSDLTVQALKGLFRSKFVAFPTQHCGKFTMESGAVSSTLRCAKSSSLDWIGSSAEWWQHTPIHTRQQISQLPRLIWSMDILGWCAMPWDPDAAGLDSIQSHEVDRHYSTRAPTKLLLLTCFTQVHQLCII